MPKSSLIVFLKHEEINKFLWDECIAASSHGVIYARSFYLDNMCPGWSALVGENYCWVVPLTHRTKWGIRYLFQPAFTQQMGIFARDNAKVPVAAIVEHLQRYASFWEVSWNFVNGNISSKNIETHQATNFVLDLNVGYETIADKYHHDLVKNLKLAKRINHHYTETKDYKRIIELYRQYYAGRLHMIKDSDYRNFENLCGNLHKVDSIICREVLNENHETLACVLLLKDDNRLYNLMNTTTETGRKSSANHFLFDAIIREFSSTDVLLDFEGSDLPGVKHFYENFGAVNQPFFRIKYNNLPWPLKSLKK